MPRRPLIVIADDLTGAAESAAIAHQRGLAAVVLTRAARIPIDADVLVIDTDTRLARPAVAARRVRRAIRRVKRLPHNGIFKKTDSVLRGPVLAELKACTAALGSKRALLVAGNPSLGRTIRDGRLFIAGRPVDRTAFANDPHHPLRCSSVLDLLGRNRGVVQLSSTDTLPRTGIIAGDHSSVSDARQWAARVDPGTLPAGAADFFRAWLQTRSRRVRCRARPVAQATPALLLHGTSIAPTSDHLLRFSGLRPPLASRVATALRRHGAAVIAASPRTLNNPKAPAAVAAGFTRLVRSLRTARAFRHLLIAGGATSAAVLRELGWTRLQVIHLWGPGVVSLQPSAAPDCIVTLKPGSYPWPASLRRSLPRLFS
jgi:uncharacterized protein YgbK (DUF1537 family)